MPSAYRAHAAWVLARWHSIHGDFEQALLYALLMRALQPAEAWGQGQVLLEVDCLNRIGRHDQARGVLDHVMVRGQLVTDYCLTYANCLAGTAVHPDGRLAWINRIYEESGFAPLSRRNRDEPLTIENLDAAKVISGSRDSSSKVSVLMPAYGCERTIEKAIRGLLAQTWRNLEIIVVDDCSPDDTWKVLRHYADQDQRITVVRHEQNTGAYGARLTALARASGDYITVHDADDWSHPQKIEMQVDALQADASLKACMSVWCRVSHNLYVNRIGAIPGGVLRRQNESSLMFHRSLVDEIGTWDQVRAAADTEYIWRIQAAFGKEAVAVIHREIPLSYSLHQEDSLTRTGPTHVRTIFHGTRRVYREAQSWWHRQARSPADLKLLPDSPRPFYCPPNLLSKSPAPGQYDLLVVADFALRAGTGQYTERLVASALHEGLSVAIFQWRRYEKPAMSPVRDVFQALAAAGKLDILAAEDKLYAHTALVADPLAPRHAIDRLPDWEIGGVSIVTGHRDGSAYPELAEFSPQTVASVVEQAFGKPARWLAVSEPDRGRLLTDPAFERVCERILVPIAPALADPDSSPMVDPSDDPERPPCVGRIALGGPVYWPDVSGTTEVLETAYCAGRDCRVVLSGLPESHRKALSRVPANWYLDSDSDAETERFDLAPEALDFFLYYPGEGGLEAAGIAVVEAMARGQVVVMDPVWEPFFGNAALYAEPKDVWRCVKEIWENTERYRAQARRGLAFVRRQTPLQSLRGLLEDQTRA